MEEPISERMGLADRQAGQDYGGPEVQVKDLGFAQEILETPCKVSEP